MLIKYTGQNVYMVGSLEFLPGVNDVDPKKWAEVEKHPLVKIRLEENILQVLSEGGKGKAADPGLSSFKDKDAVKLVKETVSKPLLEKWLAEEKRSAVKSAIQEQLDEIAPPPVVKKDDE